MFKGPLISVIIRTQNRTPCLQRALSSVACQSFQRWKVVVVNDGGDLKEVQQVIAGSGFEDQIELVHFPASEGRARASNAGIEAAKTPYIANLDDDDTWEPSFLEKCVAELEKGVPGVVTYTYQIEEVIKNGKIKKLFKKPYPLRPKTITLSELLLNNQFTNNAFAYTKEAYLAVGGYNETLDVFEDWEFNLRFLEQFEVVLIPERLANYHFRSQLKSSPLANTLPPNLNKEGMVALFKDRLLKADLKEGKVGKGTLMFLADKIPAQMSAFSMFKKDGRKLLSKLSSFF